MRLMGDSGIESRQLEYANHMPDGKRRYKPLLFSGLLLTTKTSLRWRVPQMGLFTSILGRWLQTASDAQRLLECGRSVFVNADFVAFVVSRAYHDVDLAVAVEIEQRRDFEFVRRSIPFCFGIKFACH